MTLYQLSTMLTAERTRPAELPGRTVQEGSNWRRFTVGIRSISEGTRRAIDAIARNITRASLGGMLMVGSVACGDDPSIGKPVLTMERGPTPTGANGSGNPSQPDAADVISYSDGVSYENDSFIRGDSISSDSQSGISDEGMMRAEDGLLILDAGTFDAIMEDIAATPDTKGDDDTNTSTNDIAVADTDDSSSPSADDTGENKDVAIINTDAQKPLDTQEPSDNGNSLETGENDTTDTDTTKPPVECLPEGSFTTCITPIQTANGQECGEGSMKCVDGKLQKCTADLDASGNPIPTSKEEEEVCNGADDDCDGIVDEGLEGIEKKIGEACFTEAKCLGTAQCKDPSEMTCIANEGVSPNISEIPNNDIDDNCNGSVDEGSIKNQNQDGSAPTISCQTYLPGVCAVGEMKTTKLPNGTYQVENECIPVVSPGDNEEIACDGIDQNCDGELGFEEGDPCKTAFGDEPEPCGKQPTTSCADPEKPVCNSSAPLTFEHCGTYQDDDCNGKNQNAGSKWEPCDAP
ncbi:MAG: MopE-related protein [Patescibacteria group bacterium]